MIAYQRRRQSDVDDVAEGGNTVAKKKDKKKDKKSKKSKK